MADKKDTGMTRIHRIKDEVSIDLVFETVTGEPCRMVGSGTAEPDGKACPFCGHQDCFRLNLEEGYYHCFSCEVGGDGIDLAAKIWKLKPGAAAEKLEALIEAGEVMEMAASAHGRQRPALRVVSHADGIATPTDRQFQVLEAICRHGTAALRANPKAWAYQTETRGHSPEALEACRVGYLPVHLSTLLTGDPLEITRPELSELGLLSDKGADLLRGGCFIYPHMDSQGRVCRFSQKHPGGDWHGQPLKRGYLAEVEFFGEHTLAELNAAGRVALVEGENDLLSLVEGGWTEPVLATNGPPSQSQFAWIKRHLTGHTIVTLFDADEAGERFRVRTAEVLSGLKVEQYKVPAEKDIDAYLKKGGDLGCVLQPENCWIKPNSKSTPVSPVSVLESLLETAGRRDVMELSDMDLAKVALAMQARPVLYVAEAKQWAICNENGIWVLDQEHNVLRGFSDVGEKWRAAALEIPVDPDNDKDKGIKQRQKCISHAFRLQSKGPVKDMMELAASDDAVRCHLTSFDTEPNVLGVQNGALDLNTGKFFVPTPGHMISKVCASPYLPGAKCPRWTSFLNRITSHLSPEEQLVMLKYLKRVAGESLFFKTGRRRFNFVGGPPGGGKSVFTNTIKDILGSYAVVLETEALMASKIISRGAREDLMSLVGARMILASEAGDQYVFDDEQIKRITGGDNIAARQLYQRGMSQFPVGGNLFVTGNSFPRSQSGGPAFMQRIKVTLFAKPIALQDQDPHFAEKLKAEYPGILNWMIEGAVEALNGVPLVYPKSVIADTDAYQDQANPVKLFIDECCDKGPAYSIHKQGLFSAYTQWAQDNGCPAFSGAKFYRRISELGYVEVRKHNVRCFSGLRLATEPLYFPAEDEYEQVKAEEKDQEPDPDIPQFDL